MPRNSGFTLVELLIVAALMGIIGVFTLSNYRSFGEDENLKNSTLDIQSLLRTAQTNATTNVICNDFSATWQVEFTDADTIKLNCKDPLPSPPPSPLPTPSNKKELTLGTNIQIKTVSGSSCPDALPFTASMASLSRTIEFFDSAGAKMPNCTSLTLTLENTKRAEFTKTLVIESGGRLYVP